MSFEIPEHVRPIRDKVVRFVEERVDDRGLAVIHLAGRRFVDDLSEALDGSSGVSYAPSGFSEDMSTLYEAADLVIGRGGASTVHEVAATGTPAVLVPWAASADDHQTLNVRWLADDGAAVMLPESDVAQLGDVLDELRGDDARRDELARRAAEAGEVHRSGALARLVESVADGTD